MGKEWDTINSAFNKVTSKLKAEAKIAEISEKFSKLKTDKDRVGFVLELEAVQEFICPTAVKQEKSVDHSLSFKSTGNTAYFAHEYRDAVQLYTDSIAWAPKEDAEKALSLAYGNRSAALFQLRKYEACVRDIDRALDEGYPERLQHKVLHRKAQCFMKMGDFERAEKLLQEETRALELSDLNDKKKQSALSEIKKLIRDCHGKVKEPADDVPPSVEDTLRPLQVCPELHDRHEKYLSLSSACDVGYTPEEGRYIVAKREISPGEVILVEKPFASVLLRSNYSYHCHHCLTFTMDAIPCDVCPDARFCSVSCKKVAMETYHPRECSILSTLHHSQVNKFGCLALRAVTSQSFSDLMSFQREIHSNGDPPPKTAGLSPDGTYKSNDYTAIYHLVTHDKDRTVQDLFHRSVTAVFLLKCLQLSDYFPETPDSDTLAFIGGLLLSHLQSFPCNAHEIPELYLEVNSIDHSLPTELGAGIYSTLSLFNHSCDPGVNRNFYGDVCVVRAIKTIPAGAQVSDNYGAVYATQTLSERQQKLQPQYFFTCACEACAKDWPLYPEIPFKDPVWNPCRSEDVASLKKQLADSDAKFKAAFEDLLACRIDQSLPVFLSHLALVQKCFRLPYRSFNDCQEAIKQCFSIMGNCNMSASLVNGNIF